MASSDHNNLKNDQEKQEWVTPKILLMSADETEGKPITYPIEVTHPVFPGGTSWPFMTYIDPKQSVSAQERLAWVAPKISLMNAIDTKGKEVTLFLEGNAFGPGGEGGFSYGPSWPFMTYIDPKQSVSTKEKLECLTPKIYELRSKQTESKFFVFSYEGVEGSKVFGPSWPSELGTEVVNARWISDL